MAQSCLRPASIVDQPASRSKATFRACQSCGSSPVKPGKAWRFHWRVTKLCTSMYVIAECYRCSNSRGASEVCCVQWFLIQCKAPENSCSSILTMFDLVGWLQTLFVAKFYCSLYLYWLYIYIYIYLYILCKPGSQKARHVARSRFKEIYNP